MVLKTGCLSACVTFRMTQSVIEYVTTRSVGTISDNCMGILAGLSRRTPTPGCMH